MRDIAKLAEQVGFDALWVPDHLIFRINDIPLRRVRPRGFKEMRAFMTGLVSLTE